MYPGYEIDPGNVIVVLELPEVIGPSNEITNSSKTN
jgi:hypothetical protein